MTDISDGGARENFVELRVHLARLGRKSTLFLFAALYIPNDRSN